MKKLTLTTLLAMVLLSATSCLSVLDYENVTPPQGSNNQVNNAIVSSNSAVSSDTAGNTNIFNTFVSINETVLLDDANVKIIAKELSNGGERIKLLIENNTDQNLTVSVDDSSVNGSMVSSSLYAQVAAGKKTNDSITLSSSGLELCKIDEIADIELAFHIINSDDYSTYYDSDKVRINTSIASGFSYMYDDSGTTVYDAGGIKIVVKGLSKSDSWLGPTMLLYIHNDTTNDITVSAENVSINGYTISEFMYENVWAGKRSIGALVFLDSTLEENGIQEIDEVECNFKIIDSNTWQPISTSDTIELDF